MQPSERPVRTFASAWQAPPVDKRASRIRTMFAEIAPRYDFLNHLLSLGIDIRWRRKAVRLAGDFGGGPILDVCCGTGDLALAFRRVHANGIAIVAADFCRPMLVIGKEKAARRGSPIPFVEADALNLPFPDNTFGLVSVAFGLRNVADTDRGLSEMARVCRPGGRVLVLEFTLPRVPVVGALYRWYFHRLLPRIGQALARNRHSAYNYLPASVEEFPQGNALLRRMAAAGLRDAKAFPMTFGIATLYSGTK
ncbi:MAG: bifunctional demethylmenaquinone methyltransferase/2-methoxy-6-polyprenyl-1,4-benzoquinol methylase UbiE [Thermogutta sp.]|nr:bifunctional demethylmenaquinone methyltransferase/2-methoxy-6-polyprenyl-1,4-benzoquinol methylase UbiE [Thermogutta sp.]